MMSRKYCDNLLPACNPALIPTQSRAQVAAWLRPACCPRRHSGGCCSSQQPCQAALQATMLALLAPHDPLRPSAAAKPNPHPRTSFIVLVVSLAALCAFAVGEIWRPTTTTEQYALSRRASVDSPCWAAGRGCFRAGGLVGTGKGTVVVPFGQPGAVSVASDAVVDFAHTLLHGNTSARFSGPPSVLLVNGSGHRTAVRLRPSFAGPSPLTVFPDMVMFVNASEPGVRASGCFAGGNGERPSTCALAGVRYRTPNDRLPCWFGVTHTWAETPHWTVFPRQACIFGPPIALAFGSVPVVSIRLNVAANLAQPLNGGGYAARMLDSSTAYDAPVIAASLPARLRMAVGGLDDDGGGGGGGGGGNAAVPTPSADLVPVMVVRLDGTITLWLTLASSPTHGIKLVVYLGAAVLSLVAALKRVMSFCSAVYKQGRRKRCRVMHRGRSRGSDGDASVVAVAMATAVCVAGCGTTLALLVSLCLVFGVKREYDDVPHNAQAARALTAYHFLLLNYARWLVAAVCTAVAGGVPAARHCGGTRPRPRTGPTRVGRGRVDRCWCGRGDAYGGRAVAPATVHGHHAWVTAWCVRAAAWLLVPDMLMASFVSMAHVLPAPCSFGSYATRTLQCTCVAVLSTLVAWLEWFPSSAFWQSVAVHTADARSAYAQGATASPPATARGHMLGAGSSTHTGAGTTAVPTVPSGSTRVHDSHQVPHHLRSRPGFRVVLRATYATTLGGFALAAVWLRHIVVSGDSTVPPGAPALAPPPLNLRVTAWVQCGGLAMLYAAALCWVCVGGSGSSSSSRRGPQPASPHPHPRTQVQQHGRHSGPSARKRGRSKAATAYQAVATLGVLLMLVAVVVVLWSIVDSPAGTEPDAGPQAMDVRPAMLTAGWLFLVPACWALWEVAEAERVHRSGSGAGAGAGVATGGVSQRTVCRTWCRHNVGVPCKGIRAATRCKASQGTWCGRAGGGGRCCSRRGCGVRVASCAATVLVCCRRRRGALQLAGRAKGARSAGMATAGSPRRRSGDGYTLLRGGMDVSGNIGSGHGTGLRQALGVGAASPPQVPMASPHPQQRPHALSTVCVSRPQGATAHGGSHDADGAVATRPGAPLPVSVASAGARRRDTEHAGLTSPHQHTRRRPVAVLAAGVPAGSGSAGCGSGMSIVAMVPQPPHGGMAAVGLDHHRDDARLDDRTPMLDIVSAGSERLSQSTADTPCPEPRPYPSMCFDSLCALASVACLACCVYDTASQLSGISTGCEEP